MNNWCICWFFTHIFTGDFIFKGLTARRLYKSFGVKGLLYIAFVFHYKVQLFFFVCIIEWLGIFVAQSVEIV
jgi:hypothetical protein